MSVYSKESSPLVKPSDLLEKLQDIARRKRIDLKVHKDCCEGGLKCFLSSDCNELLDSDLLRESVNLYLRDDTINNAVPLEDELILSDKIFKELNTTKNGFQDPFENQYLILLTRSDNRFEWIRIGQVLGEIMFLLRPQENLGIVSVPIMSIRNCQNYLRENLGLNGHPHFILKLQVGKAREHHSKKTVGELLKYGI